MIPLYRGELHKVSGVARQWVIPKTQIPLSVFRSALQKRNAALSEFLESPSVQTTNGGEAIPLANGTVETSGLASADGSGDQGKRGGSENDGESALDDRPENGVGSSGGKPSSSTDRSERAEEVTERRQERKRRREEDSRDDRERCVDKEDSARRDGGGEAEAPSRGKCKTVHEGSEPMLVDGPEYAVAMDCEDQAAEKAVIDSDKTMTDQVRVRVSSLGSGSDMESKQADSDLGVRVLTDAKHKDAGNSRRNGELAHPAATAIAVSSCEETKTASPQLQTARDGNGSGAGRAEGVDERVKKREELEAKLEKLRAEKHRFVLRLKQVLHEEEVKKRGSPATGQGAVVGANEATGDKHGFGAAHKLTDLEDGELEYARTPSPPARATPMVHGSASSHGTLGPPSLAPVSGRQTSLSQHLSQAYQHAASIHAQKVTSASHGHGQFSPAPSSGTNPVGASPGVSSGPPPGFSGYPLSSSSSVHSHHSHMPQPGPSSSSLPHIVGQQGVSPSSLLTTPRGPPGYHDIRLGGGTWIQR